MSEERAKYMGEMPGATVRVQTAVEFYVHGDAAKRPSVKVGVCARCRCLFSVEGPDEPYCFNCYGER